MKTEFWRVAAVAVAMNAAVLAWQAVSTLAADAPAAEKSEQASEEEAGAALGAILSDGMQKGDGLTLVAVVPEGPAAKAGIRRGDVIESIDGKKLDTVDEVIRMLRTARPGSEVKIEVSRGGDKRTVTATLEPRGEVFRSSWSEDDRESRPKPKAWLGVTFPGPGKEQASKQPEHGAKAAEQHGIEVSGVYPASPASRAGLFEGDIVVRIDDQRVASGKDASSYIAGKRPGDEVKIAIVRDGQEQTIAATLGDRNRFFARMERQRGQTFAEQGEQQQPWFPEAAMRLEEERHANLQRQRIEELIVSLKRDVDALRKEVRELRDDQAGRREASSERERGAAKAERNREQGGSRRQ